MGARVRPRRAVILLLTLAACEGGPVMPVGRGASGPIVGGATLDAAIAGTWRRTLVFIDDFGYVHSSETTWTFAATGSAVRTIVTANHTLGAADTSVATARWRLDGTSLTIELVAPSPGVIVLDVRVQGNSLLLAGQEYLRHS